jgi:signal transduction histidine kinase
MVARQTHPQSEDAPNVADLRRELAKSALEVKELRERVAAMESEGRRFLGAAAHAIRNPLTVVHSYLEILHTDLGHGLSEDQESFLAIAHANAVKLRSLVDDLVELAALATGTSQIDLAPVVVGEVVAAAISTVRPKAERKHLELRAEVAGDLSTVIADKDLLKGVVRRLLDNAVSFTANGGWVRLQARSEPDHVVIEIRDNGVGIPTDRSADVMQPFVRVHRISGDNRDGYGLGLPLCRCAAEAFGGTLDLASIEGEGTTVTLRIPVSPRQTLER